MSTLPLVSVLIPAYKSTWFETALASACQQTYANLEIIVCDDSGDLVIASVVDKFVKNSGVPIRYQRNPQPLHEMGNTAECIRLAHGFYVKFLHDDDVLHPECIARLVAAMERDPGIALASSRRTRIDSTGLPLPDILATTPAFPQDVQIEGKGLVSLLVDNTLNFIGEPSCVLCRRADVLAFGDQLMSLNGQAIHWVGDLSLYVKLLQQGNLAYLADALTHVRVSTEQFSQQGRDMPGIGQKGHEDFREQIRALGWYQEAPEGRRVAVAQLGNAQVMEQVDIVQRLHDVQNSLNDQQKQRQWFASRVPTALQSDLIRQRLAQHGGGNTIAVVVLDPEGDLQAQQITLDSLQQVRNAGAQVQGFVLSPGICLKTSHHDVQYFKRSPDMFVAQLNQLVANGDCTWLMLVEAGDRLTASGLLISTLELLGDPDCWAVFGDAMVQEYDDVLSPVLRPDFNLDYLLSFPGVMARNWLYRCDAVAQAGGFNPQFGAALELELILRMVNQQGMFGFGHLSEPLVINQSACLDESPEFTQVLATHLQERGYGQATLECSGPGQFKIDYGHLRQPQVSIVLVLDTDLPAMQRCLISLLERTRYPYYDLVIVDNACAHPDARHWLQATRQLLGSRLQVIHLDAAQGRTSAMRAGAEQARGEYLLLLRADTVMMQEQWLGELLNHGQRPEVAIVGAKAISTERKITHAGIILGLQDSAGHCFAGEPISSAGYMNRLRVDQNYSAVSDVCLLIRKQVYDAVGGLDAEAFEHGAADVDLCLRVAQQGYLTVWTPHAAIIHDHPRTAVPESSREAFHDRWAAQLPCDPAYNANLSLSEPAGFKLADAQLSWQPLSWKPLPVILARAADLHGCGHYRVIQPLDAMKKAGCVEGALTLALPDLMQLQRYAPDTLVMQRPLSDSSQVAALKIKAFSQTFKVYELDDYLPNLPVKSIHRAGIPKDIMRSLRRGLACADRFVVSTDALADALSGFHGDIQVVKNRLDPAWWGALPTNARRTAGKPRVGWAGGASHTGDLELIGDVVKELSCEVDWVFFGMCPPKLRPYVKEFHPGIRIDLYPAALARLNLDLAVAPLEDNLFNACKSNLRLLEYGVCGIPVVCSDTPGYRDIAQVTRVRNRFRDWVEAIRAHTHDLDAAAMAGDELRDCVQQHWMLDETGIEQWRKAWLPG